MKLNKKILSNIHSRLYKYYEKKRLTQNKRCVYCGNKYNTTIHHSKYCTDSCRLKAEQDNNRNRVRRFRKKHNKSQIGTSNISCTPQTDAILEEKIIHKEKKRLLR